MKYGFVGNGKPTDFWHSSRSQRKWALRGKHLRVTQFMRSVILVKWTNLIRIRSERKHSTWDASHTKSHIKELICCFGGNWVGRCETTSHPFPKQVSDYGVQWMCAKMSDFKPAQHKKESTAHNGCVFSKWATRLKLSPVCEWQAVYYYDETSITCDKRTHSAHDRRVPFFFTSSSSSSSFI